MGFAQNIIVTERRYIMAKYTTATMFTKRGNLLPWLNTQPYPVTESAQRMYAQEREIKLVLRTRYERVGDKTKLMCHIKCPVNPLPVKGEFEAPSYRAICNFLRQNGWERKQSLGASFIFD